MIKTRKGNLAQFIADRFLICYNASALQLAKSNGLVQRFDVDFLNSF